MKKLHFKLFKRLSCIVVSGSYEKSVIYWK